MGSSDHCLLFKLFKVGLRSIFLKMAFIFLFKDENQGLSYGTIISICNFCIRAMTHGDRSPSPARTIVGGLPVVSGVSPTGDHRTGNQLDRKRLLMVLEQSLTLVLSQALLCLNNESLSPRDKQLLRRELGAELGSVNETMRRYFYRSLSKSPQPVLSSAASPSGTAPQPTSSRLAKSDEQFMKFVSSVVQKVFK